MPDATRGRLGAENLLALSCLCRAFTSLCDGNDGAGVHIYPENCAAARAQARSITCAFTRGRAAALRRHRAYLNAVANIYAGAGGSGKSARLRQALQDSYPSAEAFQNARRRRRLRDLTPGRLEVDVCRCGECGERWGCSRMQSISPPLCRACFGDRSEKLAICDLCGSEALRAWMPGPNKRVCERCWETRMDRYSCNMWAVLKQDM